MNFLHAIRAELYRLLRLPVVRFALIAPALIGALRITYQHSSKQADSTEKAAREFGDPLDESAREVDDLLDDAASKGDQGIQSMEELVNQSQQQENQEQNLPQDHPGNRRDQAQPQQTHANQDAEGSEPDETAITGPSADNAFAPLADGLRAGGAVLTLALLLLGAMALARDRENGALSLSKIACSPLQILVAKASGLLVIQLLAAALLFGASTLVTGQLFEFGPIIELLSEVASAEELWTSTYQCSGIALPALYACSCFGLAISAFSKGTATALTCSLLPYFLFESVLTRVAVLENWGFITYAPIFGDQTASNARSPLIKLTGMARGYSDVYWQEGELGLAILVPLLSVGVLLALAWLGLRLRSTL